MAALIITIKKLNISIRKQHQVKLNQLDSHKILIVMDFVPNGNSKSLLSVKFKTERILQHMQSVTDVLII